MADGSNPLGDLTIGITGDFSDLEKQLEGAQEAAQEAGQAIADALTTAANSAGGDAWEDFANSVNTAFDTASSGASDLSDALGTVDDAAGSASDALDEITGDALSAVSDAAGEASDALGEASDSAGETSDALGEVEDASGSASEAIDEISDSAGEAADALSELGDSSEEAGEGAEEAEGGLEGLAEQLVAVGEALAITEGLEELGDEALEAADGITKASIALTAITGSGEQAQETIEGLEEIGQSDGLAMPSLLSAATRMQQMLGPSTDVVDVLQSVADGAAIMGTSIEQASNMFDRMASSGTANARSMVSLGLNLNTLADAMNQVTGTSDYLSTNVAAAFKALPDAATRAEVLQTALQGLAGTAEQVANQTFGGQWTTLANAWEAVMVQVGQAILPVINDLIQFTKTEIIPFVLQAVQAFNQLPAPIKDIVVAIGLLGPVVIAGTAALGALAIGINGLTELVPNVIALVTGLGTAFAGESEAAEASVAANEAAAAAIGEEGLAASVAEAGTAAGAAIPLIEGVSTAAAGVGIAGGEAAEAAGEAALGFAGLGTAATAGVAALVVLGAGLLSLNLKQYASDFSEFGSAAVASAEQLGSTVAPAIESFITSITGLIPASHDSTTAWNSFITVVQTGQGPISAAERAIEALTFALQTYSNTGAEITAMNNAVATSLQHFQAGNDAATKSATDAAMELAEEELAGSKLSPTLDALAQKAGTLDSALKTATATLDQATTALANGQISMTTYSLAVDAYNKALTAVEGTQTAVKGSLDALNQGFAQAQTTAQNAIAAFNQISAAFQAGQASLALYTEAYTKAEAAAKSAGSTFTDVAAQVEIGITAVNNQVTAVTNDVAVWQQLVELGENGVPNAATAAGNAFTTLNSTLGKLGISVTQVGDGLQFAATAQGTAAAAAQPLVDQLNALYGVTQNVINVNGTLVPLLSSGVVGALNGVTTSGGFTVKTVQALTDAAGDATTAVQVFSGASDTAAQSSNNMAIAGQSASAALANVTAQMNAAATASLNAVSPTEGEASALNDVASAALAATDALNQASAAENQFGQASGGGKGSSMSISQSDWQKLAAAEAASTTPFVTPFAAGTFGVLADGGLVSQPTLALVGEAGPELVIPLHQLGNPATTNQYISSLDSALGNVTQEMPDIQSLAGSLTTLSTAVASVGTAASRLSTAETSPGFTSSLSSGTIAGLGSLSQSAAQAYAAANANNVSTSNAQVGNGSTASGTPASLLAGGVITQQTYDAIMSATSSSTNAPLSNAPVSSTQSGTAASLLSSGVISQATYNAIMAATSSGLNSSAPMNAMTGASGISGYLTPGSSAYEAAGVLGAGGGTGGPVTTQVTLSNNLIGSQQIANGIVNQVQAAVVAKLRQAGLKI